MNTRVSIKANGTSQSHEVGTRLSLAHGRRDNGKSTIATGAARA